MRILSQGLTNAGIWLIVYILGYTQVKFENIYCVIGGYTLRYLSDKVNSVT